jgi:hypothetical protein
VEKQVQSCCVLYLVGIIRDWEDRQEIESMPDADRVKFALAISILKRTSTQLVMTCSLWLVVSWLNLDLFSRQRPTPVVVSEDLDKLMMARGIIVMLFLFVSIAATALMSSGLRDYLYGEAVATLFPRSALSKGSRNLRYFFGGFGMLVVGLAVYYHLQHLLLYGNVLIFLSNEALCFLIFLTAWRDRVDAERIEKETDK